jgi:hypothetical protein
VGARTSSFDIAQDEVYEGGKKLYQRSLFPFMPSEVEA